MLVLKCLLPFLIVFFTQGAYCKPTENELTQGRGIGSTVWGWITYPFSWWSSSDTSEAPPTPDLIASTIGPYDNVEISSRNVTVWCNDHTCTTMKCDKTACVNITCNMYDTDVTGQCREYNTGMKPEEPKPSNPAPPAPSTVVDEVTAITEATSTTTIVSAQTEEPAMEHPLELEAALSSTVTKGSAEATPSVNKPGNSSPQNKI